MKKILVSDPIAIDGIELLRSQTQFLVDVKPGISPEELKSVISQYDALIVRSETKVSKDVLEHAKNLKVIGRAGTGVDNIDLNEATKKGIVVMNVPGGNTISACEHTISLILATARNIPQANASLKRKEWRRKDFIGVELFGKTVGIIGLGKIGIEVAKRLLAFNMKVVAFDPYVSKERAKELGVELVPFDDLLAIADFITIHTPLTPQTKNLINAESIKKMKDGVRIINCARGGIIDEQALADALKSGKVKAAALDVFETEPLKESPFFDIDNVIITPHLGASTEEAQTNVSVEIAKQVEEFFLNGTIRNAVNCPFIPSEILDKMQPYLVLAEKLGLFISQFSDGGFKAVDIEYSGEITKYNLTPLTSAAVKGILTPIMEEINLNLINACVIAAERGIKVAESKSAGIPEFTNLIKIALKTEIGTYEVSGSLFGKDIYRIVKINDYYVDIEPTGFMIIFSNIDKPGVIGKIGTILGKNSINIASMEVGRVVPGGAALTIIDVDTIVPDNVLAEIKNQPEIKNVKLIKI